MSERSEHRGPVTHARLGAATQARTLKDSALWYRDFLARQKAMREQREPVEAGA